MKALEDLIPRLGQSREDRLMYGPRDSAPSPSGIMFILALYSICKLAHFIPRESLPRSNWTSNHSLHVGHGA